MFVYIVRRNYTTTCSNTNSAPYRSRAVCRMTSTTSNISAPVAPPALTMMPAWQGVKRAVGACGLAGGVAGRRDHGRGRLCGVGGLRPVAGHAAWGAHCARRGYCPPPQVTSLGVLLNHLRTPTKTFQPSNVNFGLTPPLEERMKKANRKMAYPERARAAWGEWMR